MDQGWHEDFRADSELPCNKRRPGTGCAALAGEDRSHAIFGWSEHCIATHPSDLAIALAVLDARVRVVGPHGRRAIPLAEFHRLPGRTPHIDTALRAGEVITRIEVPASRVARRSHYIKVRERASYEFALVSAAVAVDVRGGRIAEARIALGGVAHRPWRLPRAERALHGARVDRAELRAAVEGGFDDARPRRHNGFKVELAKRTVVRALEIAGRLP